MDKYPIVSLVIPEEAPAVRNPDVASHVTVNAPAAGGVSQNAEITQRHNGNTSTLIGYGVLRRYVEGILDEPIGRKYY